MVCPKAAVVAAVTVSTAMRVDLERVEFMGDLLTELN
jgi:hypothetical protein